MDSGLQDEDGHGLRTQNRSILPIVGYSASKEDQRLCLAYLANPYSCGDILGQLKVRRYQSLLRWLGGGS